MFKEPLEDGSGERLVYDFEGTGEVRRQTMFMFSH